MEIALQPSFLRAFAQLSAQPKKRVEDTLLRLRDASGSKGIREHRLEGRARHLTSLSAGMDLRIIALREGDRYTLLYVDHHDDAYTWAGSQGQRVSASEGAFPLSVDNQATPEHGPLSVSRDGPNPIGDARLGIRVAQELRELNYPSAVVRLVEACATDDDLVELAASLAPDYQEALLELATGGQPRAATGDPDLFVVANDVELRRALSFPFDEWRVFLHASQRDTIDRTDERHLAIVGGPGTGKTVCLLHRAVRLARSCGPDESVALIFHSPDMVAESTRLLRTLVDPIPASIVITDMVSVGRRGKPQPTDIKRSETSESLFLHHRRLRALLIDEAQDLHRTTKEWIWDVPPMPRGTHITVALDPNQNLFARQPADHGVQRFVGRCDIAVLDYGYRLSREIADAASRFLEAFRPRDAEDSPFARLRESTGVLRFGFRGPAVRILARSTPDERADLLAQRVSALLGRHHTDDIGVVQFLTNAAWDAHPAARLALVPQIRTPRSCKGLEFRSGVLFEPPLSPEDKDPSERWKLWSQMYVAVTRFRDQVEVIVDPDAAERLLDAGIGAMAD